MRGRRRVSALSALLVLTACDLLQPKPPDAALPIEELDIELRRMDGDELLHDGAIGPVTQFAAGRVGGDPFSFTVYQTVDGLCIGTEQGTALSSACLPVDEHPGDAAFSLLAGGGSEAPANPWSGLVAGEVSAVWAELPNETRATTILVALDAVGIEGKAFFFFAPMGISIDALVAFDNAGNELERFEFGRVVPPMDGAVPTPAAP